VPFRMSMYEIHDAGSMAVMPDTVLFFRQHICPLPSVSMWIYAELG